MKLTPWFKTSVNPVHKGVYQRKPHNLMMYSYWDGKPNWSKQVQEAALSMVLVKGMQYSAEVGQVTKMNLILGTINDLRNQ